MSAVEGLQRCSAARNDSLAGTCRIQNYNLLHGEFARNPAIQSALQRPYPRDASFFQLQRHPGAGRFVWSSAVEDDVAVARYLLMTHLEFLRRQTQSAWNLHRIFVERELIAQVDHNGAAAVELFLQLIGSNTGNAQLPDKAFPLDVLEPNPRCCGPQN